MLKHGSATGKKVTLFSALDLSSKFKFLTILTFSFCNRTVETTCALRLAKPNLLQIIPIISLRGKCLTALYVVIDCSSPGKANPTLARVILSTFFEGMF